MDPVILEITTRGLHRYEPIKPGTTTIGRALDNDIILSDPTVAPHHLVVTCHPDQSIELQNLAEVNPTRLDGKTIDSISLQALPATIETGRVQFRLLSRDMPVPRTRPLAGGNGNRNHLFGNPWWTVLLVLACLVAGGLEYYLNTHNLFKWSDLLKYLLRETVLTIGGFVLALAVLERLLVNRWEIRQLLTTVCLVYLAYDAISLLAGLLDYLVLSNWPSSWLFYGWYLTAIPIVIVLYLVHVSHLSLARSYLLAFLIASPIALPAILQSPRTQAMLDSFSPAASYHRNLSYLDWHLRSSVDIDTFIEQAGQLDAGKAAD